MDAFYQDRAIIHSHQDQIVKVTVVIYDLATLPAIIVKVPSTAMVNIGVRPIAVKQ